jgi:hypothetical protein
MTMGKTDDTSKAPQGRNQVSAAVEKAASRSRPADSKLEHTLELIEAIEVERARLMKAESILHCAIIAMTEDDDFDDGETPYYPSVIEMARDLVNQALEQLDSVKLGPMIEKLKGHAETPGSERGSGYEGVKETYVEYRLN